ncbi:hypothetical protein EBA17_01160 [Xanthomonas oryzae pv. oryzae]|nr:hypothetical protein EBA17_01160 [Xanthomonas oryzae pv. oryzae]
MGLRIKYLWEPGLYNGVLGGKVAGNYDSRDIGSLEQMGPSRISTLLATSPKDWKLEDWLRAVYVADDNSAYRYELQTQLREAYPEAPEEITRVLDFFEWRGARPSRRMGS